MSCVHSGFDGSEATDEANVGSTDNFTDGKKEPDWGVRQCVRGAPL